MACLRGLVADRRARPGDLATDVLTRLIQGETAGEQLSETERYQNCIFILNAGHETTWSWSPAMKAMWRWPSSIRWRVASRPPLKLSKANQNRLGAVSARPVTTTGWLLAQAVKALSVRRPVNTMMPSTRRERSPSSRRASASAFQWPLKNSGL